MPPEISTEAEPTSPPRRRKPPLWVRLLIYSIPILIVGAIVLPNFFNARSTSCGNSCIANLKYIDGAIQQWALENHKTDSDVPDMKAAAAYLKNGIMPKCPAGGVYSPGATIADPPKCSMANTLGHSLP